jgi:hypothetical protein
MERHFDRGSKTISSNLVVIFRLRIILYCRSAPAAACNFSARALTSFILAVRAS